MNPTVSRVTSVTNGANRRGPAVGRAVRYGEAGV